MNTKDLLTLAIIGAIGYFLFKQFYKTPEQAEAENDKLLMATMTPEQQADYVAKKEFAKRVGKPVRVADMYKKTNGVWRNVLTGEIKGQETKNITYLGTDSDGNQIYDITEKNSQRRSKKASVPIIVN